MIKFYKTFILVLLILFNFFLFFFLKTKINNNQSSSIFFSTTHQSHSSNYQTHPNSSDSDPLPKSTKQDFLHPHSHTSMSPQSLSLKITTARESSTMKYCFLKHRPDSATLINHQLLGTPL